MPSIFKHPWLLEVEWNYCDVFLICIISLIPAMYSSEHYRVLLLRKIIYLSTISGICIKDGCIPWLTLQTASCYPSPCLSHILAPGFLLHCCEIFGSWNYDSLKVACTNWLIKSSNRSRLSFFLNLQTFIEITWFALLSSLMWVFTSMPLKSAVRHIGFQSSELSAIVQELKSQGWGEVVRMLAT